MTQDKITGQFWKSCIVLLALVPPAYCQELDLKAIFKEGLPSSPFITVVYRYADTMLERGRDTYGPQKSGLFLSALDRKTLSPLNTRPPAPAGIRETDRPGAKGEPLAGANPQLDENFLRLLYFLSSLSSEIRYAQAANDELTWFLKNTQSQDTGLLPWGEHLCWIVTTDSIASGLDKPMHEFSRPWMLWDKCFELAPQESRRFALGLWNNQITDHNTGAFDRHAGFAQASSQEGMDFARHAGFYIRTWAESYDYTKDEVFLKAIDVLLSRYERKRHPKTGLIELKSGSPNAGPILSLSLAIDCDSAARKVPQPLRQRLIGFAAREDEIFCSLPHRLEDKNGFLTSLDLALASASLDASRGSRTGKPQDSYTSLWDARYGGFTTAAVAMMCVSRYENTGKVRYRDFIVSSADIYKNSLPGDQVDAWPMTFGHAISLELAAFRITARDEYYKRAFELGKVAVERFFGDCPLPRASLKTDHYESITGADTLAIALAELHLNILHITAVRAPSNTIDR